MRKTVWHYVPIGVFCSSRYANAQRDSVSAYAATGLQSLGEMPWGSHVCQFFSNDSDLRDTLVPYFKAGLENNERCLLVAMEPFTADDARSALRAVSVISTGVNGESRSKLTTFAPGTTATVSSTVKKSSPGYWPAKSRRASMATMASGPMETSAGSAAINGKTSRTMRQVSREVFVAGA